jgi:mannose/cellobiose epimerase-like protein (N-acyl-D-glucosamine 2-epimerase family)
MTARAGNTPDHGAALQNWLVQQALPLWSTTGINPDSGLCWEAIDSRGHPCHDMPIRLRVQARQSYVFSLSSGIDGAPLDLLDRAEFLFEWVMEHGFAKDSGHLSALTDAQGVLLAAPHDLYDLSFVLLAAAGLVHAGKDMRFALDRLDFELSKLKAPRGWYETAGQRLPRRQNPHMHLFEAATQLFAETGQVRWRTVADECLDLLRTTFWSNDQILLEMFDADWRPDAALQQIEPGHFAEWIWLLDQYENITGQGAGIDFDALWAAVLFRRSERGRLPDTSKPLSKECRLWPQTEFVRAAIVMQHRSETALALDVQPRAVLAQMWADYFETAFPGGWQDRRLLDGTLIETVMPASSFYHIFGVIAAVAEMSAQNAG